MSHSTHLIYEKFIQFIQEEATREKFGESRRIMGLILWCLIFPVCAVIALTVLSSSKLISIKSADYSDWMIILVPVFYSIYQFWPQMTRDLPRFFTKGGMTTTLDQSLIESKWRIATQDKMMRAFPTFTADNWSWISKNFEIDLSSLMQRNRYITVLSGIIFFLLLQGLDLIEMASDIKTNWDWLTLSALIQSVFDKVSQFVALIFFLSLVNLSAQQTHQALYRYLECVRLMSLFPDKSKKPE